MKRGQERSRCGNCAERNDGRSERRPVYGFDAVPGARKASRPRPP
jgi:hypothetical protein